MREQVLAAGAVFGQYHGAVAVAVAVVLRMNPGGRVGVVSGVGVIAGDGSK